jgi:hypothetical protein
VHDPAVRMPAVPVLISENPTESGVISLTLHPGVAFGAGFSSFFPLIFSGSFVYVRNKKLRNKRGTDNDMFSCLYMYI